MPHLVDGATRVVALVSHVLLSALVVFSTAWLMHPGPGASAAGHVVALCGFLLLSWVFVGGEMFAVHLLGFREPDWVMIPRFGVMAAVVLLAGRVDGIPTLRVLAAGVVAFAVLRSLFHVLVVMHQRVEGEDAPRAEEDPEDLVVVELDPALTALLLALGPVVSLYLDVLRVLYGTPNPPTPDSP